PGNVRELKNVIRRAVLVCEDPYLSPMDFPQLLREHAHGIPGALVKGNNFPGTLLMTELEKWAIRQALAETHGRQMKAAILVGMGYQKFKRKLKKYAIQA
ncbi:MAG: hypothetical protein GY940_26495, partial [bacterium]|nr:hypothetical protein [bacterium]